MLILLCCKAHNNNNNNNITGLIYKLLSFVNIRIRGVCLIVSHQSMPIVEMVRCGCVSDLQLHSRKLTTGQLQLKVALKQAHDHNYI